MKASSYAALAVSALLAAPAAYAQSVAGASSTELRAPMPAGPGTHWSAYDLLSHCRETANEGRQGQCIGAVRGLIHGYQYGVLFLSNRLSLNSEQIKAASLCLNQVSIKTIVDEFVGDANQVSEDSLRSTPAEVALLGSVHMHHPCQ